MCVCTHDNEEMKQRENVDLEYCPWENICFAKKDASAVGQAQVTLITRKHRWEECWRRAERIIELIKMTTMTHSELSIALFFSSRLRLVANIHACVSEGHQRIRVDVASRLNFRTFRISIVGRRICWAMRIVLVDETMLLTSTLDDNGGRIETVRTMGVLQY